jgi:hypothetical protein
MKTKSIEVKAAELTRALIEIQLLTRREVLDSDTASGDDTASGWEPVAVERLERVARIAAAQLRRELIG